MEEFIKKSTDGFLKGFSNGLVKVSMELFQKKFLKYFVMEIKKKNPVDFVEDF